MSGGAQNQIYMCLSATALPSSSSAKHTESKMGLSRTTKDSHVLKLVHPGGFVELHNNPVMAAQVMNKNPRHFVTRPDIFRFPWIVVSPESILRLGSVFFIVPCSTIRHLLKSTTTNQSSFRLTHHHPAPDHQSSADQDRHRGHKISGSKKNQYFKNQSSRSPLVSCMKLRTPRGGQKQRKEGIKAQSFVIGRRPAYSGEFASDDVGIRRARSSSGRSHSEQVTKLKSCLKKDQRDNARSRNLKVRFACTNEDDNNANFTRKFGDS